MQHRPAYHFLPPSNWMNDPNGLIQWRGEYHLFYQHNPNGPFWGSMHWGHAVSRDLVHWQHLPIALAPTPGGADADGCWSGCAIDADGVPTLIYSGDSAGQQRACIAISRDDLRTWEKHPGNPVIPAPPTGLDLVCYRDHCVWKEDGAWYQLVGAGIAGAGGTALLYRSDDLLRWEYMHPLCVGDLARREPVWTGPMWECPSFFRLGQKHVLIVSVWDDNRLHHSAYMVGSYAGQRFTPEVERRLDYGDRFFYAPQTFRDERGRLIVMGWLPEARSEAAQRAAGWAGVMSLPRILTLRADGTLGMEPVPELEALRDRHIRIVDQQLAPSPTGPEALRGDCVEIDAEFAPGHASACGLVVRRSPCDEEQTPIVYDHERGWLSIDTTRSSLGDDVERGVYGGPFALEAGEPLRLHVFVDRSTIEVFANGRACITARIYPSRDDSLGVRAFARGEGARLAALDAWTLRSIW